MRRMIEKILSYYASECEVTTADGVKTVRAFLEPVQSSGREGFLKKMHALGEIPDGRYVYIGPISAMPEADGRVICGGREFTVCRAETLFMQDEPVYVWGLLRSCGGIDDAGTD